MELLKDDLSYEDMTHMHTMAYERSIYTIQEVEDTSYNQSASISARLVFKYRHIYGDDLGVRFGQMYLSFDYWRRQRDISLYWKTQDFPALEWQWEMGSDQRPSNRTRNWR